jgi:hypothetical protein
MQIDNVTKEGKEADGFIIPAGAMFPLGAAIPNHIVSQVACPGRCLIFDTKIECTP